MGKTYAMLEAAQARAAEGVDVLAGYIETHGRRETAALLAGLELLPRRQVRYQGAGLEEFDLDAALARRPQLILVDELAHSNAPGSRHPKRWQDVRELLAAGVDVYTTLNVQHLESLNDLVAQITGVIVRETVPDSVLEQADEVALIDLTPDQLRQRLSEGKVYVPAQAERAAGGFFRAGNLHALRELALRHMADRVDQEMRRYRQDHAISETWPAAERLLVCVGPNPAAGRLIRAARRMAARLRAPWVVVYVETPGHLRLPEAAREAIIQNLRLAESLGAETVTLSGGRVSEVLLAYARQRNVSKIVIGKPASPTWRERLLGSLVDEIVRGSGQIDVYAISGAAEEAAPALTVDIARSSPSPAYGWAIAVVAASTTIAGLLWPHLGVSDLALVYLIGIVLVASRFGRGPSVLASVLSVLALNFFFTQPYLTLFVSNPRIVLTLVVILLVALVISSLTARTRRQAEAALQRERRTSALYALSRAYASTRGIAHLISAAVEHTSGTFDGQVALLLPDSAGLVVPWGGLSGWWGQDITAQMIFAPGQAELGVAGWVYDHAEPAGLGTNTLPGADAIYLPLKGAQGMVGVLGLRPNRRRSALSPEQLHLLETFVSQTALAFERALLAEAAQRSAVQVEAERLRNALLSSVSHDLRTPLAVVAGALSSALDSWEILGDAARIDLIQNAYDEAERLSRLLTNLLEMTRLEAGGLTARKEWQPIEEVVGAVIARMEPRLAGREITLDLPADLPLVPLDAVLIEQVLLNLLENAVKYTPPGAPITLRAEAQGDPPSAILVMLADRGAGLRPGDEATIFAKFNRGSQPAGGGSGLGLTISQGIVRAHGGQIWAENRPGGGAIFAFTLPIEGAPPQLDLSPDEEERPHD
ncbi:sensor histidine kinase KdpD [Oscillochloris sp. ZM17-4]|uniref:DUF4118 domain-containing protein n=1 Tax=Oscillochloris sp. ZM17-4 TaxID=2866714 RepID=UPI001C73C388|nr:sensor histidine kinase KdpD [Oscillochloris sp. ZM17-4]